jgi:hypothetical protein
MIEISEPLFVPLISYPEDVSAYLNSVTVIDDGLPAPLPIDPNWFDDLPSPQAQDGQILIVVGWREPDGGNSGSSTGGDPYSPGTEYTMDDRSTIENGFDPLKPNCRTSNQVDDLDAPDGAEYLIPEGVTNKYIIDAVNHVRNMYDNNPFNKPAVALEIKAMYDNPSHRHFVDFKDWGSPRGPANTIAGGSISYWSDAAGRPVSANAFEPFGNFFYGALLTFGGFSPEEIHIFAAAFSEGNLFSDDPQDVPHVQKGIAKAKAVIDGADPLLFSITPTNCKS